MGLLLQSLGFAEFAYQTQVFSSGSLCGAISGGHHNRAWRIHEEVSEELQRILYKRFLHEKLHNISNELIGLASD